MFFHSKGQIDRWAEGRHRSHLNFAGAGSRYRSGALFLLDVEKDRDADASIALQKDSFDFFFLAELLLPFRFRDLASAEYLRACTFDITPLKSFVRLCPISSRRDATFRIPLIKHAWET